MEEFSLLGFMDTLDESRKYVRGLSFGCACDGCDAEKVVNSHLIQQNPFIYSIADENKKVFQIIDNEIHPRAGDWSLKKERIITVNRALSVPLFCDKHDNDIFKPIETESFEIANTGNQLLFSYRALCAQRYLEQKRLALYQKNGFKGSLFEFQKEYSQYVVDSFDLSITNLWNNIQTAKHDDYVFKTSIMPRLPICLSDSIIDEDSLSKTYFRNKQPQICNVLYVHMLPYPDCSKLIIGYDNSHVSKAQIDDYNYLQPVYDSIDYTAIIKILTKCTNWCCSIDFIKNKTAFVEYLEAERVKNMLC